MGDGAEWRIGRGEGEVKIAPYRPLPQPLPLVDLGQRLEIPWLAARGKGNGKGKGRWGAIQVRQARVFALELPRNLRPDRRL